MSDYDTKEQSVGDGSAYELYEFVGTYATYRMTTDKITHNFLGNDFPSVPGLERSNVIVGTQDTDNAQLKIKIPITEQIVIDNAFYISPPTLKLTIYRFQRDASAYITYWSGKVLSWSVKGEFATANSLSKLDAVLKANIPSVTIQPPCNNILFDARCKISRALNSVNTTVIAITGNIIQVASIGSFAAGWFIGGELVVSAYNERRMIVAQSGQFMTVNYEFAKLVLGTAVQIASGCDNSFAGAGGCPKYSNQLNFTGMPYMPGETNNVFTKGLT